MEEIIFLKRIFTRAAKIVNRQQIQQDYVSNNSRDLGRMVNMPGVMSKNEIYILGMIELRKKELESTIKERKFIYSFQLEVEINLLMRLKEKLLGSANKFEGKLLPIIRHDSINL